MSAAGFTPMKPRPIGSPKAAVAELVDQAGGVPQVMVRLGLGKTVVYGFTDPLSDVEISFARVAALSAPGVDAGARYLALLAGGVFVPLPRGGDCLSALTAEAARQHGEAIARMCVLLADGRLDRAEARKALPEIDEALAALSDLRGSVAAVAGLARDDDG